MLEEHGYRARIVIERLDGGAITDADRVVLNDATSAAEEHGTASPQVRERVVAGHLARSRTRLAAKGDSGAQGAGSESPRFRRRSHDATHRFGLRVMEVRRALALQAGVGFGAVGSLFLARGL